MKPRKRLPAISQRQKQRNQEYAKAKRQWWKDLVAACAGASNSRPLCECCTAPAEKHPHHKYGKVGPLYWWIPGFMAVCRNCHCVIHNNRAWAISKGYLALLGQWNNTKLCTTENPTTNTKGK